MKKKLLKLDCSLQATEANTTSYNLSELNRVTSNGNMTMNMKIKMKMKIGSFIPIQIVKFRKVGIVSYLTSGTPIPYFIQRRQEKKLVRIFVYKLWIPTSRVFLPTILPKFRIGLVRKTPFQSNIVLKIYL